VSDPVSLGEDNVLVSDLPYVSCTQRVLAERMIIMLAHSCAHVVNFVFAGRNSGRKRKKEKRNGSFMFVR
jgi:hypothetical protein